MYNALSDKNAVHVETQATSGSMDPRISGDGIVVTSNKRNTFIIEGAFTVGEFTVEAIRFRVREIFPSTEKTRPESLVCCQLVEAPHEDGWQTITRGRVNLIISKKETRKEK